MNPVPGGLPKQVAPDLFPPGRRPSGTTTETIMKKVLADIKKVSEVFTQVGAAFEQIGTSIENDDAQGIEAGVDVIPNRKIITAALIKCGKLLEDTPWDDIIAELAEDGNEDEDD